MIVTFLKSESSHYAILVPSFDRRAGEILLHDMWCARWATALFLDIDKCNCPDAFWHIEMSKECLETDAIDYLPRATRGWEYAAG